MWDPRLRGRMTMLDDPFDTMGASLKKLGFSVNASDPAQLDRARAEAIRQKPLLRAYLNAEARDQLSRKYCRSCPRRSRTTSPSGH